ncbi:acetyltransferase [Ramlibacter tataouinensis]|uniref:acetyltransferase n=1 Tax=Ramlibacter tataouinensis TaxID=94132 RepID=UPI0022F3C619|nr:acetyltransferase [Ramlibacter tataouinensis]WBY02090.1 acetyltransferase [Ramlibacter tataouinensis]
MKRLALLGCGGHGKVVADAALAAGWDAVEFFDDAWPTRSTHGSWSVVGDTATLKERCHEYDGVIVAIGDCDIRWEKHQELVSAGATMATIVHPVAWVSPRAKLGAGCVVIAGAVINVDAQVGDACIVNTRATIDHDCVVRDAVHVAPGAHLLGNVNVGARTWVGAGAVIKQGTKVGTGVLVGAGTVVIRQVADGVTVVGNPARVLEPSYTYS